MRNAGLREALRGLPRTLNSQHKEEKNHLIIKSNIHSSANGPLFLQVFKCPDGRGRKSVLVRLLVREYTSAVNAASLDKGDSYSKMA